MCKYDKHNDMYVCTIALLGLVFRRGVAQRRYCQKCEDAKEESGLKVFRIPARSPELNVCDYALWKAVAVRRRAQEKGWPKNTKESRDHHVARLRETAKSLPASFVRKSIGDIRRRCQKLYEAKGHHFEEGGGYRKA